jgi:hypothetical protein
MVVTVWQKGVAAGLFSVLTWGYAILAGVAVFMLLMWALRRFAAPMAALGLLALWWGWGGTYAPVRDALLAVLVSLAVLTAFPASRLWLRTRPALAMAAWQRWRAEQRFKASPAGRAAHAASARRLGEGAKALGRHVWHSVRRSAREDAAAPALPPPPKPPVQPRLSPGVLALAALAVWAAVSAADAWFEAHTLPRRGTVLQPPGMPAAHAPLRVGLALSGGGYRAALVHAGVVDALGELGLPVNHLSSVSGGSIIGSFF